MRLFSPLLCASILAAPVHATQTYGLVIGIDEYERVSDLQGAVNDARDIADALQNLDADVTLLLNGAATRAAVLGAWQNLIDRAAPGDTLIVTYAGHGSNEPEHNAGNEEDGLDENFLLAGFSPYGAAAGERIRDDEIADLIAQRPDIDVIFVADACHSGTVTRNLNPTLGYRYVSPSRMENDPLPPPPPRPSGDVEQDEVALFLAAVNEAQKVPEFLIDGEARGALSYAFAQAIRGDADQNGDNVLTKGEIEEYIRRTVRDVSDGSQLPQAFPTGATDEHLIALSQPYDPPADLRDQPFSGLDSITLLTEATLPMSGIVIPVSDANFADAHYDFDSGRVTSSVGDVIATLQSPAEIIDVAKKMQLASALMQVADPALSVRFTQGDKTYTSGDIVTIDIDQRSAPYITLINIAATGDIAFLYPTPGAGDPLSLPIRSPLNLSLQVAQPFGADHVIAIQSETDPRALRANLARLDGTRDVPAIWEIIRNDRTLRTAVFPFFSTAAP